MASESQRRDFEDLSVSEKILRVQELWDDIARTPGQVQITPAQREEAERRLLEHERDPGDYPTWEDVRRRLENGR